MSVIEQVRPSRPPILRAPLDPDRRFVIGGVNWQFYEKILDAIGNCRIGVTYDRGTLELMSPSSPHEYCKTWLGRFIDALTEELNIPMVCAGSVTCRRQDLDRGLEPDVCFYIQNVSAVLGVRELDFNRDPPPDLAVEVDITRSSLDRMAIYAALGVPELWRYDGARLWLYRLGSGRTYEMVERSPSFPFLPPEEVVRLLEEDNAVDDTTRLRALRERIRTHIVPLWKGTTPDS